MPSRAIVAVPLLAVLTLVACQDEATAPTDPSPTPAVTAAGAVWTQVTVGAQHTCALASNGHAYCWGHFGPLGTGSTPSGPGIPAPTRVAGGLQFAQISAGTEHTCAITTEGKAYCWGRGVEGQLGQSLKKNSPRPVAVSGGLPWQAILPGSDHTCG